MSLYGNFVPGERLRTPVVGKSKTKQSFKKECDINLIMAKLDRTGAVSHFNKNSAEYGYATSLDFAESMRVVTTGQRMFDELPASIRNRFLNDPGRFLDFVQDEANAEEMVKLGLVAEREPAKPVVEADEEEAVEEPVKAPEAP